jgi:hypothetical protein
MTKPSQSLLNQQNLHVLGVCDVMQVFVGDFVRPEYLHYLSQTGVVIYMFFLNLEIQRT